MRSRRTLTFGQRWVLDHEKALRDAKHRTGNGLVWVPPSFSMPSLRSKEAQQISKILAKVGIQIDSTYMIHVTSVVRAIEIALEESQKPKLTDHPRPKVRRKVCEKCKVKRKNALRKGLKTRIGRPCPECGGLCGCSWHRMRSDPV